MWAVVEMKRVFHFHGRSRPEYEVEKCVQLLKSGTVTNPPNESLFSHFREFYNNLSQFHFEVPWDGITQRVPLILAQATFSQILGLIV